MVACTLFGSGCDFLASVRVWNTTNGAVAFQLNDHSPFDIDPGATALTSGAINEQVESLRAWPVGHPEETTTKTLGHEQRDLYVLVSGPPLNIRYSTSRMPQP